MATFRPRLNLSLASLFLMVAIVLGVGWLVNDAAPIEQHQLEFTESPVLIVGGAPIEDGGLTTDGYTLPPIDYDSLYATDLIAPHCLDSLRLAVKESPEIHSVYGGQLCIPNPWY